MVALVRYKAARAALAAARSVDEVKEIRDKVEAMRCYAIMANDTVLEADAAELRVRAERRLGQLLIEEKAAGRLASGTRGQLSGRDASGGARVAPPEERPKLADLGIDKHLSARAQRIAGVEEGAFEAAIARARKRIREGDKVSLDIAAVDKIARRADRERELGARQRALPQKNYGVIYVDYPRRFRVYSRDSGLGRSPENHYPTMTFDEILALPVPALAAPDCVLFMWSTAASLLDDLEIMAEWGFIALRPRDANGRLVRGGDGAPLAPVGAGSYRSHAIWLQDRLGLGFWFREVHEILLVGARGKIVAPAPGTQDRSVIGAPLGRHSEKPTLFAEMIERLFPTLPKIELFARVARPGWDRWGYEAPDKDEESPATEVDAAGSAGALPGASPPGDAGAAARVAGEPRQEAPIVAAATGIGIDDELEEPAL
jgi:N6-adenosine-specific RNA methylase IME4